MGIGKASDFKIYNEEFYGGMVETLTQNADAFNAASNGALKLVPTRRKGDQVKESFLKLIANLITRRDTTSVAAVTDLKAEMGENIAIKINRKIGPIAQTLDAWRKVGLDSSQLSFVVGQQVGQAVAVDYINTSLSALVTALLTQATVGFDHSAESPTTMTHSALVSGMAKLGDAAGRIVCYVMHSKPYFDLMGQSIADKIFEVAGVTIREGTIATFGKPTIVLDSPALIDLVPAPDNYFVLGLVPGAATVEESEEREIVSDVITGLENLVGRVQGEYAFNLGIKGFTWDSAAGVQPTDAALATAANWDLTAASIKDGPGIIITTK